MASSFEFYSGEDKTLTIRLNKTESDGTVRPYSIAAGSTVTILLPASPSELELTATIDNYDLGEIHVDLTDTQTSQMISGDIIVTIQSGSTTRIAKLLNGVRKLKL